MKKYRVSGTGVHAIKLVECTEKAKKEKGVTWFESLKDAKEQVLKNNQTVLNELIAEKQRLIGRLKITNDNIKIMQKPINLDVVTDDYLRQVNIKMKELYDKECIFNKM